MHTLNLIGNTPLIELTRLSPHPGVRIYGKWEGQNPGGSVKDRTAWGMIRGAELRGELPGKRIVEPTSGNTGIALAMIARLRGYEIELLMPQDATRERILTMQAFGASVTLTPAAKGMEGAIDLAREKAARGEAIMLDQFSNPDNPQAHYETTGPEIWQDTAGSVTHFISAMGTTGTIMGVAKYLKQQKTDIQIIGVQPTEGSDIPGIRRWPAEYRPKIFQPERVDRIVDVTRHEAEEMMRRLARDEGLFCGISAGGAVHAAHEIAQGLDSATLVTILCDRGERYLSIFS